MAPRKKRSPAYTPEAAERRRAGAMLIRLTPETAALARELAVGVPGGLSGLVAALVQQRAHLRAANGKQRRGGR